MRKILLAAAVAGAALAITASGPAFAAAADTSKINQPAASVQMTSINQSFSLDRVATMPVPKMTRAVMLSTASPLILGRAGPAIA